MDTTRRDEGQVRSGQGVVKVKITFSEGGYGGRGVRGVITIFRLCN